MELRLELNCKKSKGKPNIFKSSTESHEVGQQRGRVAGEGGSVSGSRGVRRGRKGGRGWGGANVRLAYTNCLCRACAQRGRVCVRVRVSVWKGMVQERERGGGVVYLLHILILRLCSLTYAGSCLLWASKCSLCLFAFHFLRIFIFSSFTFKIFRN